MQNRKAFLLNEMILILALLGVILLLSVEPMRIFFRNVLDVQKAFDRQGRVETVLRHLRQDAENAELAYVQAGDVRLGGDVLYLVGPGGAVCYRFDDGNAMRLGGKGTQEWELPQVEFDWRALTLPGGAQAVAISTRQRHKRRGDDMPAFSGSYVFVVNLNAGRLTKEQP